MKALSHTFFLIAAMSLCVACADAPPDSTLFTETISCKKIDNPQDAECIEARLKDRDSIEDMCKGIGARIEEKACDRRLAKQGCKKPIENAYIVSWRGSQNLTGCEGETLDLQGHVLSAE